MPIQTVPDLREHLELAIRVELSTIPLYLYAMYSIEEQGSEAALLIRSIVTEEMLHAVLASNLLLAIGGNPRFDTTDLFPVYPALLAHHKPDLELNLAPCSSELIQGVLMVIEKPKVHSAPDQPDQYETIGQFYHAIETGLQDLAESSDLFAEPQIDRQMSNPAFYAPVAYDAEDSGGLMQIKDIDSALAAIEIIVHQGEGLSSRKWADPAHQELTHYHKLGRINTGDSPLGAVRPVPINPHTADYPSDLQSVSDLFNATYRFVYLTMAELFQARADKDSLVNRLYMLMLAVMSPLAIYLVTRPLPGGGFAAPTFEIYEFDEDPATSLANMARSVASSHQELSTVAETLGSD